MPELPDLDPVVHGKMRLAVLSLLSGVDEAEFTWLREKTGSTDGNLGAHLLKLEEAGYVAVEKKFVARKPVTLYRMTESGRAALERYIAALKELLALQRADGGWSLPAFADWKGAHGQPNDTTRPSDGYATGLVVYVLRQSGMGAGKEPLKRGVAWLKANQRESGRWYTRSLNADRAHYTTNAGTAFALMALKACGVSDE